MTSLSRISNSSNFQARTSLFPLKDSAIPWKPSSSTSLFPRSLRCLSPFRSPVSKIRADRVSVVKDELVRALYERLSVRRLGNSFVINGRMGSVERGGVEAPELESERTTFTKSGRPHPSRFSSSKFGNRPPGVSDSEGSANDLSWRRFIRTRIFRVCAKGWVAITDKGSVGDGTAISVVLDEVDCENEDDGAAKENARVWARDLVGGFDGGSVRVCETCE